MEIRNKKFVLIFASILLLSSVSAIRINEVEINPLEGKEWIELYNNEDEGVNISNWKIYDGNPQKIFTVPNETLVKNGDYYIILLNRSWLNNDGDYVTLYDSSNNKIDETENLKEEEKSIKTHQLCSSTWKFMASTKGSENNCSEQIPEQPQPTQNQTPEEETAENLTTSEPPSSIPKSVSNNVTSSPKATTKSITLDAIELNSKDIKSEEDKEILKKNLALAGVVSFCLGFGALFLIKTLRRKNQNEFR